MKKLTDEQLMVAALAEIIEAIKEFRNGLRTDFNSIGKATDEAIKRGIKLGVSENLIHRAFQGEFDNADELEFTLKEVK